MPSKNPNLSQPETASKAPRKPSKTQKCFIFFTGDHHKPKKKRNENEFKMKAGKKKTISK